MPGAREPRRVPIGLPGRAAARDSARARRRSSRRSRTASRSRTSISGCSSPAMRGGRPPVGDGRAQRRRGALRHRRRAVDPRRAQPPADARAARRAARRSSPARPSELHALGARMVADFLEADGWEVLLLGAGRARRRPGGARRVRAARPRGALDRHARACSTASPRCSGALRRAAAAAAASSPAASSGRRVDARSRARARRRPRWCRTRASSSRRCTSGSLLLEVVTARRSEGSTASRCAVQVSTRRRMAECRRLRPRALLVAARGVRRAWTQLRMLLLTEGCGRLTSERDRRRAGRRFATVAAMTMRPRCGSKLPPAACAVEAKGSDVGGRCELRCPRLHDMAEGAAHARRHVRELRSAVRREYPRASSSPSTSSWCTGEHGGAARTCLGHALEHDLGSPPAPARDRMALMRDRGSPPRGPGRRRAGAKGRGRPGPRSTRPEARRGRPAAPPTMIRMLRSSSSPSGVTRKRRLSGPSQAMRHLARSASKVPTDEALPSVTETPWPGAVEVGPVWRSGRLSRASRTRRCR